MFFENVQICKLIIHVKVLEHIFNCRRYMEQNLMKSITFN